MALALLSCEDKKPTQTVEKKEVKKEIAVPAFDGGAAYDFVARQCSFGPRVPESKAHDDCATWLIETLKSFADTVYVQNFRTRLYNGKGIDGTNIIAAFNPEAKKRIVLSSHWDSRPFADHDPDEANWNKPIDGANDGASGVGVLLAISKALKNNPLDETTGIDVVLFDLEDYGPPAWVENYDNLAWGLGSQYWSKNFHKPNYRAYFGILLDMVGASEPRFPKEYYSHGLAPGITDKVWRTARQMGYEDCFINEIGQPINDDHIYMNQFGNIPTVDIIHLIDSDESSFYPHWHTLGDNMSQIDKNTLQMVGNVLMKVIYE